MSNPAVIAKTSQLTEKITPDKENTIKKTPAESGGKDLVMVNGSPHSLIRRGESELNTSTTPALTKKQSTQTTLCSGKSDSPNSDFAGIDPEKLANPEANDENAVAVQEQLQMEVPQSKDVASSSLYGINNNVLNEVQPVGIVQDGWTHVSPAKAGRDIKPLLIEQQIQTSPSRYAVLENDDETEQEEQPPEKCETQLKNEGIAAISHLQTRSILPRNTKSIYKANEADKATRNNLYQGGSRKKNNNKKT